MKIFISNRMLVWIASALAIAVALGVYLGDVWRSHPLSNKLVNPSLRLIWSAPTGETTFWTFSPSGKFLGMMNPNGVIRVYTITGVRRYVAHVPGTDRVCLSTDCNRAAAYSLMDANNTVVVFLDSLGAQVGKMDVGGPIWSVDVTGTGDDTTFAIGTGRKRLYLVNAGSRRRKYRKLRTEGAVVSVSFEDFGRSVLYGTWQQSRVVRATLRGRQTWSLSADPASLPVVKSLVNNSGWIVNLTSNRMDGDGTYTTYSARGNRLWSTAIVARENTRALTSSRGKFTCMGFDHVLKHSNEFILENHGRLIDRYGRTAWNRVSLFFRLDPLAVTDAGTTLVPGDGKRLYTILRGGTIVPCLKLPGAVVGSLPSPESGFVMIHCSDAKTYILKLAP